MKKSCTNLPRVQISPQVNQRPRSHGNPCTITAKPPTKIPTQTNPTKRIATARKRKRIPNPRTPAEHHLSAAAARRRKAVTTAESAAAAAATARATALMESLEALVAHIQGLSGSPEEVAHLHSLLKQADGEPLRAHAAALVPFLAHLSPETHSLGYLYLLEACATSGSNLSDFGGAEFLVTVAGFLTACSPDQIRLAPDKFLNVCRVFKDQVMQLNMPIRGIAPLRAAVRKIQSSPEQLTPVHADYLLLCLLAKQYKAGLSVLEDDIFDVDHPRDLFLYCYYGGMIYIGLKQFPKALELLHNAVTSPMSMLNAISVEAYKKYILVSLIVNGQVPSFPKYTSVSAQRSMKNHAQMYVELCTSYSNGRYTELETFVQANSAVFQSDNNLGLVKQVLSSMYKRNIQRLTQTYLTLSLEDIARSVQLDTPRDAEMHVLRMIEDGEIHATINQKDGMVSFHEDPEQYKSVEMVEHIDLSIQRLTALSKKLASIDENMACDPAYLLKTGRDRGRFDGRFDYDDFDSVPHKYF